MEPCVVSVVWSCRRARVRRVYSKMGVAGGRWRGGKPQQANKQASGRATKGGGVKQNERGPRQTRKKQQTVAYQERCVASFWFVCGLLAVLCCAVLCRAVRFARSGELLGASSASFFAFLRGWKEQTINHRLIVVKEHQMHSGQQSTSGTWSHAVFSSLLTTILSAV